ncbi:MAG: hypothetical protein AAB365_03815 [Patescibacteria group bacterium]
MRKEKMTLFQGFFIAYVLMYVVALAGFLTEVFLIIPDVSMEIRLSETDRDMTERDVAALRRSESLHIRWAIAAFAILVSPLVLNWCGMTVEGKLF